MDHLPAADHDMLVAMHTTLQRMDKALFGNGQPGLMAEHNRLQQEVLEVRTDLEKFVEDKVEQARAENAVIVAAAKQEVKLETPTKGQARFAKWSSVAALATSIFIGIIQALTTVLKTP